MVRGALRETVVPGHDCTALKAPTRRRRGGLEPRAPPTAPSARKPGYENESHVRAPAADSLSPRRGRRIHLVLLPAQVKYPMRARRLHLSPAATGGRAGILSRNIPHSIAKWQPNGRTLACARGEARPRRLGPGVRPRIRGLWTADRNRSERDRGAAAPTHNTHTRTHTRSPPRVVHPGGPP